MNKCISVFYNKCSDDQNVQSYLIMLKSLIYVFFSRFFFLSSNKHVIKINLKW